MKIKLNRNNVKISGTKIRMRIYYVISLENLMAATRQYYV